MNVTRSATTARTLPSHGFAPDAEADADPDAESTDDDAHGQAEAEADEGLHDADTAAPVRPACGAGLDEPTLRSWLERIVDRDERALTALYDATLSRVYGIVLRIVRRPGLAEEVVEDTYFQVWRQAARFDPARGRPLTWLLGMARSRAIDALRREARFRHDSLDSEAMPEVADGAAPVDELLEAAREHAELHRALLQLQAQPRQLVALAFFRGLSHEEIADQTRLPLGTVKSQIRRSLITLRQLLGDGALRAAGC